MSTKQQDIAIIGMSCVFPKAPDLAAFWQNILAGVDAIGEPPEGAVGEEIYDPESDTNVEKGKKETRIICIFLTAHLFLDKKFRYRWFCINRYRRFHT